MTKGRYSKIAIIFLSLVLAFTMMPTAAFAAGNEGVTEGNTVNEGDTANEAANGSGTYDAQSANTADNEADGDTDTEEQLSGSGVTAKQDSDDVTPGVDGSLTEGSTDEENDAAQEISDPDVTEEESVYPDGFTMSLPVVRINVDGGQSEIDRMNSDDSHEEKCTGTLDIEVPEGFAGYSDQAPGSSVKSIEGLKIEYIRGRGNSTWSHKGKRPYKIKLDKKASLLGMDRGKHWALIANAYDPSMMRNRLTFWLGKEMGMDYTPTGYPVDVFMGSEEDGYEYYGSYLLCEIAKNHIDIDQVNGESTDITGGYLMSVIQDPDTPGVFVTGKKEELQNIDPSFDPDEDEGFTDDTQKNYIRDFINRAEAALFEGEIPDQSDPSGYKKLDYLDYFDTETAAKFWLFEFFTLNGDAYGNGSTYFYKTKDSDEGQGKIYWGPLWDYDFAWDYGTYDNDSINVISWIPALMGQKDGNTLRQAKDAWNNEMKPALLEAVKENGIIDQYYAETSISQGCDYQLNGEKYPEEDVAEDYAGAVDDFKEWIIKRIGIVDEYINNEMEPFSHAVYFRQSSDDEHPQVMYYQHSYFIEQDAVEAPEKKGYLFAGWVTEDGRDSGKIPVTEDMTVYPSFVKEEEASRYERIYFNKYDVYCTLDEGNYYPGCTLIPEDAMDKRVTWKSSDESVASVEDDGFVYFHKTGKVRISVTTPYGVSNSFDLTITDTARSSLISADLPETVYIIAGDTRQIGHSVEPKDSVYEIVYSQDDFEDEIAEVNSYGVVTAKKAGMTTCTATFYYIDKDNVEQETEKTCRIIVSESEGTVTATTKASGIEGKAVNLDKTAEKLLTDDEAADVKGGADAEVWLEMTRIDEKQAPEGDRYILKDYLDDNDMTGGCWLDISLFKKVGEKTSELHETAVPVSFSITIPEELRSDDPEMERTYYLLRAHGGKVSLIASGTDTVLTGESSLFSTYMLAYRDTKVSDASGADEDNDSASTTDGGSGAKSGTASKTVKTGDTSFLLLWITVLVIAALLGIILLILYRRRQDREQ